MFLKILSFDLEVLPLENQMPRPELCPILLLSCHFNYDYEIEGTKTRNIVYILTKLYDAVEVQNNKIVYYVTDESKIIYGLAKLIRENDVITGYNISGFDIPYVYDRAIAIGIRRVYAGLGDKSLWYRKDLSKGFMVTKVSGLTGKIVFDVLGLMKREDESNVFKKKYNLKKLTLEHVSKEILEIHKLEFPVKDMPRYWKNTDDIDLRNKFIDYCSRDSEIPLVLLTRFRLLDKFITLSKASGKVVQEVINSMGSGGFVENLLLKEFRKYDRVLPIRLHPEDEEDEDEQKELEGAEVFNPILGVSENICSVDYKSLYPSLMIKYNLCYSTIILEPNISKLGLTEADVETQYDEYGQPYAKFVRKEKFKGIVPRKLEELLALRASQKKEMKKYDKGTSEYLMWDAGQNATKILLNSHYGYTGDTKSKIYSWFVATAVTTNGRKQIKKTWHMILDEIGKVNVAGREFKLGVVMGDTDSSYMQVISSDNLDISRNEAISSVTMVLDKVNATLEKPMQLDFENYVKRIMVVAKKHYAYLSIDDKGKESITSKGIETVRRDWCNFSTHTMSDVIDNILKEKDVQVGIHKSIDLVKERARLLKKNQIDVNDLVLSKKLTKPITLYDNDAVHVKVAIKMKERGKPSEVGDRIQYIITNNGKKLVGDRAEEAEYVIEKKLPIDKNYYIRYQLLPPLIGTDTRTGVLELLGVTKDYMISSLDEDQQTLDKWFVVPIEMPPIQVKAKKQHPVIKSVND